MSTPDQRRVIAARFLTAGGLLVAAAAVFHFVATPHLSMVLKRILDAKSFEFLDPIVAFTFDLNGVLLLPLSFSTLVAAAGIRRGERWAWWVGLANALTVIALPCLIAVIMGPRYFAGAPLFVGGAASIAVAGLLMVVPLVWTWRDAAPSHRG